MVVSDKFVTIRFKETNLYLGWGSAIIVSDCVLGEEEVHVNVL
jgi:hypothetical protein